LRGPDPKFLTADHRVTFYAIRILILASHRASYLIIILRISSRKTSSKGCIWGCRSGCIVGAAGLKVRSTTPGCIEKPGRMENPDRFESKYLSENF
jgi:hypothetical protein